jgi:hypothetical protein
MPFLGKMNRACSDGTPTKADADQLNRMGSRQDKRNLALWITRTPLSRVTAGSMSKCVERLLHVGTLAHAGGDVERHSAKPSTSKHCWLSDHEAVRTTMQTADPNPT